MRSLVPIPGLTEGSFDRAELKGVSAVNTLRPSAVKFPADTFRRSDVHLRFIIRG